MYGNHFNLFILVEKTFTVFWGLKPVFMESSGYVCFILGFIRNIYWTRFDK